MKIVHICLCGPMTDGLNYQENVLTKYHRKMGHDVTIIASEWVMTTNGKLEKIQKSNYYNSDDVKVIRLPLFWGTVDNRLKKYKGLYRTVVKEEPDILFIHDCQFLDMYVLRKYIKKNKMLKVYVDNHVDYSNGAKGWLSRNILHKGLWRLCVKSVEPYVSKFYGVLPARVDFLQELYGIPKDKCELLVMGADDELVEKINSTENRKKICKKYNIKDSDFIVVTGGKINKYRLETLNLMSAVIESKIETLKLIIFGSVDESIKEEFYELCKNKKIIYVGWQNVENTYRMMSLADIVVFPGLHSVMWEQAVALGTPCIFRKIKGFNHVDLGGNAIFLEDVSKKSLMNALENVVTDVKKQEKMKECAVSKGKKYFSYKDIAKRSIEIE